MIIFINIENKYESLQYPSGCSHFSSLETLYSPCACGLEFSTRSVGGWREWRGANREDPDGRDGKMSERISLVSPFSPELCLPGGFTMKTAQKRTPARGKKNFFEAFRHGYVTKSSVVQIYKSHPSTKTEAGKPPSQNFWNPGIFSETKVTWNIQFPSGGCSSHCFTNCQLEKQRQSQHHILGSMLGFQETPGNSDYGETSHICPGGAVHLATVLYRIWTIFQSDRGFPTFIPTGSPFLPDQSGWLSRRAPTIHPVSGNAECTPF